MPSHASSGPFIRGTWSQRSNMRKKTTAVPKLTATATGRRYAPLPQHHRQQIGHHADVEAKLEDDGHDEKSQHRQQEGGDAARLIRVDRRRQARRATGEHSFKERTYGADNHHHAHPERKVAGLGPALAPADIVFQRAEDNRRAERQRQQRGDDLERAMGNEHAAGRCVSMLQCPILGSSRVCGNWG